MARAANWQNKKRTGEDKTHMRDIKIRPAEERDYEKILELNAIDVSVLSPLDHEKLVRMAACTELFQVAAVSREAAVEGGTGVDGADGVTASIAAFLMAFREKSGYWSDNYRWFENHFDRFLYVDRIVVDRNYRQLRIGKMMYEGIIDYGRNHSIPLIAAEIDVEPIRNDPSLRFHKSMGFREVGTKMFMETIKVSLQTLEI